LPFLLIDYEKKFNSKTCKKTKDSQFMNKIIFKVSACALALSGLLLLNACGSNADKKKQSSPHPSVPSQVSAPSKPATPRLTSMPATDFSTCPKDATKKNAPTLTCVKGSLTSDKGIYVFPELKISEKVKEYRWDVNYKTTYQEAHDYKVPNEKIFAKVYEKEKFLTDYRINDKNVCERYGLTYCDSDFATTQLEVYAVPPGTSPQDRVAMFTPDYLHLAFASSKEISPDWFKTFFGFNYSFKKNTKQLISLDQKELDVSGSTKVIFSELDGFVKTLTSNGFVCTNDSGVKSETGILPPKKDRDDNYSIMCQKDEYANSSPATLNYFSSTPRWNASCRGDTQNSDCSLSWEMSSVWA
jgi:hypothetical protein